ncbi:MAG: hypothetical protein ACREVK_08285 [Gammaproteobacteria bacterium]
MTRKRGIARFMDRLQVDLSGRSVVLVQRPAVPILAYQPRHLLPGIAGGVTKVVQHQALLRPPQTRVVKSGAPRRCAHNVLRFLQAVETRPLLSPPENPEVAPHS